jgi:S1-C subfamily serine protease
MGRTTAVIFCPLRILLLAIPALLAPTAPAQTNGASAPVQANGAVAPSDRATAEMRSEEIFSRFAIRVLFLTCDLSADDETQASGVLVSADGFFVTNADVVEDCRSLTATYISGASHRSYAAALKYYDKKSDTAVLKIEDQGFDFFNLIVRNVLVGERVYAIGNPRGLEQSMSEGIVSGLRDEGGTSWIQHSSPISPGSSGGR